MVWDDDGQRIRARCLLKNNMAPTLPDSGESVSLQYSAKLPPEIRLSLANGHADARYVELGGESSLDLVLGCRLEEEFECLDQVLACFVNRAPLAGDV